MYMIYFPQIFTLHTFSLCFVLYNLLTIFPFHPFIQLLPLLKHLWNIIMTMFHWTCFVSHLVPCVSSPSKCSSCSELPRSASRGTASGHSSQHRAWRCSCDIAPLHLCNTAPRAWQNKTRVRHRLKDKSAGYSTTRDSEPLWQFLWLCCHLKLTQQTMSMYFKRKSFVRVPQQVPCLLVHQQ